MNKVYKTVLNRLTGQCVVTSELARGKVKSKSVGKILTAVAGLMLSSQVSAIAINAYNTIETVADGSVHESSTSANYVWLAYGGTGGIEAGSNVTINMVNDSYIGVSANNGATANSIGSYVNVGNNFHINNNVNDFITVDADGNNIARIVYVLRTINGGTLTVGDNLKITQQGNNRSRAIQSNGVYSSITIGKNAWIESTDVSLQAFGNRNSTAGLATLTVGENATLFGRVNVQYNADITLGAGSQIIRDKDVIASYVNSVDELGMVTLNGQGASIYLEDVYLRSNDLPDDTSIPSTMFRLTNVSFGELSSDAKTDGYSQKMYVNGATARFGASDENGGALHAGDFAYISLSKYRQDTSGVAGHAYAHLKDINVESAGGHLVKVVNEDYNYNNSLGEYDYVASANKATIVIDNVDGSTLTDGIHLQDSGAIAGEINVELTNNTQAAGGATNDSAGDLNLIVNNNSTVTGDITNNGDGNITNTISNGGRVNGDVINNGSGDLVTNVNNGGSLVGDVIHNGTGNTDINVNEGGNWIGTGKGVGLWVKTNSNYQAVSDSATFTWIKSDHNATIDFGSPVTSRSSRSLAPISFKTLHSASDMMQTAGVGNIKMSTNLGLGKGDLVAVDGTLSGAYAVDITNYGGEPITANESLRIIYSGNGSSSDVSLTGNQYRDAGMYRYYLEKDASGNSYWLVNGDGTGTSHGGGDDDTTNSGNAYNPDGSFDKFVPDANFVPKLQQMSDLAYILEGSASAQTIIMLNQSANVTKHMNEVRLTGKHDSGIWLNNYYTNTRVDKDVMGSKFTINTNTTYLGADKVWNLDNGSTVIAGVFAGMGFSDNKYKLNSSKGDIDVYTGGAYGMWLHNSGLFADLTAQGYRVKSSDNAYTAEGAHTNYDVKSNAFSLGLDVGKRFDLSNGIYLEPALKLSYLHNGGDNFDTNGASAIKVKKTSTDIFQYGAGLNIGKTITTSVTNAFVQPYFSVTALKQDVSGGDIQSGNARIKSKLDGYQVQSNLGINWQINKNNGVFTEVNASTGDKYNNTFGIAAGYRYSF